MTTPGPRNPGPVGTPAWSPPPPLPVVLGFEHSVVRTPGSSTDVATVGEGEPVVLLPRLAQH